MNVLLRVDASERIGMGHAMRLLTLADALCVTDAHAVASSDSGVRCTFVARHMLEVLASDIHTAGHDVLLLPGGGPAPEPSQGTYGRWLGTTQAHDADQTVDAAARIPQGVDRIVVDHYGLGTAWERAVGTALGAPVWAVDDLLRDHSCAGLVDTTFGRQASDYHPHMPRGATVLAGARFALLRPGFAAARKASLARHDSRGPARDLLISMGGMDIDNATGRVLDAVESLGVEGLVQTELRAHVMLGAQASNLAQVRAQAARMSMPVSVHAGVNDVPALLSKMDLCVGAAGSSTWERCCLGLPTINLVIADNQRTITCNLSAVGAVRDGGELDGFDAETFARDHLAPLLRDAQARHALSVASRSVADGLGASRVAGETALDLVPATRDHIRVMHDWQSDAKTRAESRDPETPKWEDHMEWCERRLEKPNAPFYIIEYLGRPSGVVRLDPRDTGGHEVSVLVAPDAHGRGIGTRSLRRLVESHPSLEIHAFVKSSNPASQRAFEKSGFARVSDEQFIHWGEPVS